jgi:translocation and assembly module TamA
MFRFVAGSCLVAIVAAFAQDARAQTDAALPDPAAGTEGAPPSAPDGSDPELSPRLRRPLPPIPEIDAEWQAFYSTAPGSGADALDADTVAPDLRYRFDTSPISRFGFTPLFRQYSALLAGADKPAPSLAELRRRMREDTELLITLFRSKGFYDPEVQIDVEAAGSGGQLAILPTVDAGPLYRLASVDVIVPSHVDRDFVMTTLGLAAGDPLEAERINLAVDRLNLRLTETGFPFAKPATPDILVDHEDRSADLSMTLDTGPKATIGAIAVAGEPLFSAKHVSRLARFKPGDIYSASDIEDLRRALVATGLVGSLGIEPVAKSDNPAATVVDLVVTMTPAPMRTLAGQVGFSTTDGFRVEASWQHRNLIRPQGAVTLRGVVGTDEQRLSADLRRSNWKRRDRTLGARIAASREDRDAFFARTFELGAHIERETNLIWQKTWVYSLGAELLVSQERDRSRIVGGGGLETFYIAAAPLLLTYDGSDDLLDPSTGFRLTGRLSPELAFSGDTYTYIRAQIDGSGYLQLGEKFVLAARARLGTILGAERRNIAPTRRFYAGGGGSVRGYGFQGVGPRDADNDPLGGRSITELSIEGRYRFGQFGIVPFIDAGQVYTTTYPKFYDLRFGAGIGARYYTNFGPIRIDVATPIDPRKGDPRVGVYVSIGQAF